MLHTILLTNLQTDNLTEYLNGHNLDEKTYRYIELTEGQTKRIKEAAILHDGAYIK